MAILRRSGRKSGRGGSWSRCPDCAEILPGEDVTRNHKVCPACGHHYPNTVEERMALLLDEGSFAELDGLLETADVLRFKGAHRYKDQLSAARKRSNSVESVRAGTALVEGQRVAVGFVDTAFLQGSLGCVAAERLCGVFELAAQEKLPAVMVTAGGGARHAEGVLALSQVARLAGARDAVRESGVAFLSVLVAPLPGGVAQGYAFSGDVNLAEPGLVEGDGGGDTDALLHQGLVDRVVFRAELKAELSRLLRLLT
ncbi:MAG: carboxyl transferase domain-containing protein [bacterium]